MKVTTAALVATSLFTATASAHGGHQDPNAPRPQPLYPRDVKLESWTDVIEARQDADTDMIGPRKLVSQIKADQLVAGTKQLQAFSDKYSLKNRVFGGPAHMDSVNYILSELQKTGFYDARLQKQVHTWSQSNQSLTVNGVEYEVGSATYVPNGNVTGNVVPVNNLGCNATDFPARVKGKIALISRGTCTFGDKIALSGNAGAIGAIVYNNEDGQLSATLGSPTNPLGLYVPAAFVTQEDGKKFLANRPPPPVANVYVSAKFENRTTYNVIAETKGGDHDNVIALGAHTDSVNEGPGIQDNGSGSIGILTVAKALTKYKLNNAVRFLWWTAEEFGLLGSEFYVDSLTAKAAQKIRLYMNFDMIASPNYSYQIYDGDGSAFNLTGPPGSAQIEKVFEDFYARNNLSSFPTAFDGRSDYGPFLDVGIPAGGLFTGAEDLKSAAEAKAFGGKAGEPYDACYHQACDTFDNLNFEAFETNTRAIAFAVGLYARNVSAIPVHSASAKRAMVEKRQAGREERLAQKAKEGVRSCGHTAERVEI